MPVDRCICHDISFRELKAIAEGLGGDLAALSARTGCCTGCGLCRPYVQAMLRTGRTEFQPMEPEVTRPPEPGTGRGAGTG